MRFSVIKKLLALMLVLSMPLSILTACGDTGAGTEETGEQTATQSPEEAAVLKVLTIGNSHAVDATRMLYEVFQAQEPDREVVIGTLYKSGCMMSEHAAFATGREPAYVYYKNDSGTWTETHAMTLEYVLSDEQWDVVVMQELNTRAGVEEAFTTNDIQTVIDYVKGQLTVEPTFAWHFIWPNPVEDSLLKTGSDQETQNYQERYELSESVMYTKMMDNVEKYVLTNETFDYIIPTGTAVLYAITALDQDDLSMYRDYTHLTDYGRLMAAYVWYARLTGTELTQVNLSTIPASLQDFGFPKEDKVLTDAQKQDLIDAVNYAIENPYENPAA